MAQLTCKNLKLGYDNKVVIENLNFNVNRGDYLCIIGENGSGKSTLMKTILNLQPSLGGEIITGDGLIQNEIGYLPQQTIVQKDFPATVKEIVFSGCLNQSGKSPFYSKEQKQTAYTNMKKLNITNLEKCCYRELSGGQQQRVLLARALCATKTMLLLDEPVSGLDPRVTADMYNMIKELNKSGITIIMISHDVHSAIKYASHVLHIGNKQLFFGSKADYVNSKIGQMFMNFEGSDNND